MSDNIDDNDQGSLPPWEVGSSTKEEVTSFDNISTLDSSPDTPIKNNIVPFELIQSDTKILFDVSKLNELPCNKQKDVYGTVEYLRSRGFTPLPTRPQKKLLKKIESNAPEFDKTNFQPGDNVSILLGAQVSRSGVQDGEYSFVDLDLEVEEARIFAHHYLSDYNTCCYGRKSSPKSHHLFKVKTKDIKAGKTMYKWPLGIASRNKEDSSSSLILELRTSGHALVPCSTHPSGEILFWMNDKDPVLTEYRSLNKIAGIIASGSILLRHWSPGIRDNLVISTAGWLLKEGYAYIDVMKFLNTLFACAWPIDRTDIVKWRVRIQEISNEVIKMRESGEEIGDEDTQNMSV